VNLIATNTDREEIKSYSCGEHEHRVMSPVVSSLLLTVEVRVKLLASPCKIIAGESATGTGLPPSSLVFSCPDINHPNSVVICHRHYNNPSK
jgi:hypothetical protein